MRIALCIAILALLLLSTTKVVYAEDPCSLETLANVMRSLESLSRSYVDTSEAVKYADRLVKLCRQGSYEEASKVFSNLTKVLENLNKSASRRVYEVILYKVSATIFLGSIPIAVYVLLPRAYLWLWYLSRRRWYVVKKK